MSKKYIYERILLITYGLMAYFLLINFEKVLKILSILIEAFSPVILGAVVAFLLNMPMSFLEKKITVFLKKVKIKDGLVFMVSRAISLSVVIIVFISIMIIIINVLVPQLVQSLYSIIWKIPNNINDIELLLKENIKNTQLLEWAMTKLRQIDNETVNMLSNIGQVILGKFVEIALMITTGFINLVIGIIIAIYTLLDKEKLKYQLKLIIFRINNDKYSKITISILKLTYYKLRKYIGGQLTDALILFIMIFVSMTIFKMPYTLLVSSIIGVSAIIPIFGPFIGAVISILIMFIGGYSNIVGFAILVIVMQQIEGNIVYPIVVGNSIGLSSLYIIVAVIVFSDLFGILGIIIGVPLFSVFYAIMSKYIKRESLIE